ncbi:short-chain dehydrogenase reductase sdr : 3-oxoacyl-(Acyl-carrier-protein) reductase OS=Planctomyces brasiliensis (strain ATCC 49424 / DSM 5305 / JCM 21570 / NBRC 103401 / IFAM 1448) GN=Plabr_2282 PE=3 SV=1: adh_short [Gemmata massiliana]|uniref:Oxidoreductase n=1 Tax=Gemmata massiliana TaxID=1210884 RepID=A0A6P2D1W0_9BACT|nr:SDR family oxidoreductase [Gemmata massiliana]VTR95271.1 short-chain dehydrogenase reductase sdr : 3-oxoacyl-(Acyl-carrier-protein) reductase OS=Planctomyces brasiliensis (strain ATCC 49424 / DSM 5305 / JCM 21570 / NBRC 103401 / IFAM 1448) GN=Plabr_2282 PE=3 SV=1: adh_short [Gemmata massiliana]
MSKLANKVAVVTGGGSGVGKSAAALFLKEGAKVVIAGRDGAKLAAVAKELNAGDSLRTLPTDVTKAEQCQALIDFATKTFGRVDILVNNAGTNIKDRTLRELTPEAWDMMIRTNLDGAFYCTKAVLPQMFDRKDGVIVNVVSVAGKRANPLGGAAYVAAKFAMGGLGLVLSNEEKDSGVRVSNIYPGEIDTPILAARPKPVSEEQRAVILKPEDVAEAVLFVASLPARVSIPELVIKPTVQMYW